MGEIADALKKSKSDKGRKREDVPGPASPDKPEERDPGSYHDAMKLTDRSSGRIGLSNETDLELTPSRFSPRHIDIEAHRHLAVAVRSSLEKISARSLAVVSALRNEGKTTVACNLAAALASLTGEREVALVDLDLRNPTVRRCLGLRPKIGLESFLLGQGGVEETCIHLKDPNLDVYPALVGQRNAHELLVTPLFESMIHYLESRYRLVLFDTPPCLMLPDSNLILQRVAAYAVVVRAGESRVNRLREALHMLPEDRQLGAILNGVHVPSHRRDYEYYQSEEDSHLDDVEET